ncbi:hypothetical protein L207DRAFT_566184 [Hyaloscypha variabilis F]|uniref:Uncharacterized protein n=1 Tax=Hyaloscypha variabilis (strain UAMH 11265 / GT02V1 / F) TaxID=1149755 RepID=A0A2J6RQN0_HYAVF|nr:hypothetical protein L207DRAFT_566184 [Hyaloscypha variabilis F]
MKKVMALLQGKLKDDTFDALHKGIAENWVVRDETVKPFGDRRQIVRSVCSFDLDQDTLYYSDETFGYGHIKIPISRFRDTNAGPVQQAEFSPFELASPPPLKLTDFPPPFKKPSTPISDRRFAFTSRVLSDFADQWRHVLRSCYADPTFRRFAKAIVSIAMFDFQVQEISTSQHISFRNYYVSVLDLPSWEPCESHILRLGGTTIVLDQNLWSALKIAKDDAKPPRDANGRADSSKHHRIPPTVLLDGLSTPASDTIHLLLQALAPASRPPPRTPVHHLPLEMQDRILEQVSKGPIEAARLGCLLDLGSPFMWLRSRDPPRRDGILELIISPSHRNEFSPVESKICFGDVFSGVSYK